MKTVIRTSCEETELEWPDRRLFCLLLWDRWLRRRRLFIPSQFSSLLSSRFCFSFTDFINCMANCSRCFTLRAFLSDLRSTKEIWLPPCRRG